jgi:hypothetical protein
MGTMGQVFVVMSNDFPDAVFSTQEKADIYCKRKNAEDEKEYPYRRIFYKHSQFTVDEEQ